MKQFLLILALSLLAMPALAAEPPAAGTGDWLKRVESKFVCMMNDRAFDKEQMAIEIDGKTYYGCCEMCKGMLQSDPSAREATDPVSDDKVNKADAIIGRHGDVVYYFETMENFEKFASGPMPDMPQDSMDNRPMHDHASPQARSQSEDNHQHE